MIETIDPELLTRKELLDKVLSKAPAVSVFLITQELGIDKSGSSSWIRESPWEGPRQTSTDLLPLSYEEKDSGITHKVCYQKLWPSNPNQDPDLNFQIEIQGVFPSEKGNLEHIIDISSDQAPLLKLDRNTPTSILSNDLVTEVIKSLDSMINAVDGYNNANN